MSNDEYAPGDDAPLRKAIQEMLAKANEGQSAGNAKANESVQPEAAEHAMIEAITKAFDDVSAGEKRQIAVVVLGPGGGDTVKTDVIAWMNPALTKRLETALTLL